MRSIRAVAAATLVALQVAGATATPAAAQTNEPAAGQAQQQPTTRREVGDWTVICAAAGKPCAMEQLGKTAQGETAMSMQVEKLPQPQTIEGKRVEAVGTFLVPLGVLIQQGLRLRIDSGQTAASPYFLCQQNGCIVRAPMEAALLEQFRRGSRATLSFAVIGQNGQPREISATISLSGFTRAYNSLP
jgi:invasion protein IalB